VPHIFCAASGTRVVETDFGVIHLIPSSLLERLPENLGVGARKNLLPWHTPLLAGAIERFLLTREGPHLIHGFGTWGCVAVTASRRLRKKAVDAVAICSVYTTTQNECRAKVDGLAAVHGYLPRIGYEAEYLWTRLVVARYERRAWAESRLVTVNYESVHRLFLGQYGRGAEVRKLPYTSESAFLHAEGPGLAEPQTLAALQPRDAPLVVSVSRHDPRKGLDALLQALARLRTGGVRFRACLVSGGPLLGVHRELATRLALNDVTAIEGWVPDPYPYLQRADVFVLPSLQEGSGSLALIEALQAGVAVVASNVDGIPEDVTHGDSALLVAPGRVADLADAIGQVVSNVALRHKLASRARKTFVQRFSADAFTRALGETYAGLGLVP
jgi:glycosyltransferase involved in cell wall biosynthesis